MEKSKQKLTAVETLENFVLRARRVGAHSLAQSRDQLRKYATTAFSGRITVAGKVEMLEELPEEEAFESLVARLRPLVLDRESIFYVKVLDAIEELTGAYPQPDDEKRITDLRAQWQRTDARGTQVQGYTLQALHPEKGATSVVSDSQLAAGWIYIDLVHVDPQGPKTESLQHTLKDRFTAAVRIYSGVALLALETLDYLEELRDRSLVALPDELWNTEVTVSQGESPIQIQLFMAEVGTTPPDLAASDVTATGEWKPVQITDLLRQKPENRIAVVARYEGHEEEFDAAILRREEVEEGERREILVDNCAIYTIVLVKEKGNVVSCRFEDCKNLTHTNAQKLQSARLARKFYEAASVDFSLPNAGSLSLSLAPRDDQALLEIRVAEEAMGDVVAIESITEEEIDVCDGDFNDQDRIVLRQARLLWEGQLVRTLLREVRVISRNGEPPSFVDMNAESISFAGRSIPTPAVRLSHESLEVLPVLGPSRESDGEARVYLVRAPKGQLFAWSPEHLRQSATGEVSLAPWNLTGIDEILDDVE